MMTSELFKNYFKCIDRNTLFFQSIVTGSFVLAPELLSKEPTSLEELSVYGTQAIKSMEVNRKAICKMKNRNKGV